MERNLYNVSMWKKIFEKNNRKKTWIQKWSPLKKNQHNRTTYGEHTKKRWPTKKIQHYLRLSTLHPHFPSTNYGQIHQRQFPKRWSTQKRTLREKIKDPHKKKNIFIQKRWTMKKKFIVDPHFSIFRRNKNIFTNYFFSSIHKKLCVLFKCAMKKI